MLNAHFDTLITPLSIDVSTGDAITPHAVQYQFSEILDDEKSYELWAYNIETVMAEKVETILRRGVFNTVPEIFTMRTFWQPHRNLIRPCSPKR